MNETQFDKERYADLVNFILGADGAAADIPHYMEFNAPTEELAEQARVMFPHTYSNSVEDWKKHNLTRQAIKCANDNLQKIRQGGIGTHMTGHAAAFLFKKTLGMYVEHLLSPRYMNRVWQEYAEDVQRWCRTVLDAFDPVFQVLTWDQRDFTLREKQVLLRAFWQNFTDAFDNFWHMDPHELAIVLYEAALKRVPKTLVNQETGQPTEDDLRAFAIEQLQELARVREIDINGTKEDLVQRLLQDIQKRGSEMDAEETDEEKMVKADADAFIAEENRKKTEGEQ